MPESGLIREFRGFFVPDVHINVAFCPFFCLGFFALILGIRTSRFLLSFHDPMPYIFLKFMDDTPCE